MYREKMDPYDIPGSLFICLLIVSEKLVTSRESTYCSVSVEPVTPLLDSAPVDSARLIVELLHQETHVCISPKLWAINSPFLNLVD